MAITDPNEFIRLRGVTRCPTACAVKTTGRPSMTDRDAIAAYYAARETADAAKLADEAAALAH